MKTLTEEQVAWLLEYLKGKREIDGEVMDENDPDDIKDLEALDSLIEALSK